MKKFLLTFGVATLAMGAYAAGEVSIENLLPAESSTFEQGDKGGWYSWGNDSESTVADEGYNSNYSLKLVNPTAADTYSAQAACDIDLVYQETYIIRFWAKSSVENGSLQFAYQMDQSPYTGGGYTTFEIGTDWTLCEKEFTVSEEGMTRINLNFGAVAATYLVDDIELGQPGEGGGGENPGGVPEGLTLLASADQTDGVTFVKWNDEFENTTVDGVDCVSFTNAEAGDSYSKQLAIDLDYAPGDTYYITFDVMGDVSDVAISAWYQYKATYTALGYNDFNSFKVTSDSEWTNVVLYGSYEENEEMTADRVVINLGEYVGTLYMTNFKVYGPSATDEPDEPGDSGIDSIVNAQNINPAIYTLQGMKVNAENVNGLRPGIYIVNGKKVVVK